jgi:hypothetical protein
MSTVDTFHRVNDPIEVDGQRARGLRFADQSVQAIINALSVFRRFPQGFSNRDLRIPSKGHVEAEAHHRRTRVKYMPKSSSLGATRGISTV